MSKKDQYDEVSEAVWKNQLQSKLSRIERLLKWLVVRMNVDSVCNAGFHAVGIDDEKSKKLLEAAEHLAVDLPDISDII